MTTLRSGGTVVEVIAEEGAVAASLMVDEVSVLARTDCSGAPPAVHEAPRDEDSWVRSWRGGWQLCLPYAGQGAEGEPFHGRASQTAWRIESTARESIALSWQGDGVRADREWRVGDGVLTALTTVRNDGDTPVPLAPAEHLVLGEAVIGARAELTAGPGTTIRPLDERAAPTGAVLAWPGDPGDAWDVVDEGRARLAAITPATRRTTAITVARADGEGDGATPVAAEVRWDASELPHALLWQEVAATTAPPWDGRIRALGVEPGLVAHGAGPGVIADLPLLLPGARRRWSCSLTVRVGGAA